MENEVVAMKSLKANVTCNGIMAMDNYMQKGTPTSKIFKNDSVLSGWYQYWISRMIEKVIIKISSGTITHDVTQ